MTQEQLIQEARKEAEKVYPDIEINLHDSEELIRANVIRRRDNSLLIEGFIQCYIQQAEKRKSELIAFLDSIRAYEHESGKAISYDERESEEFVNIYIQQQLKQE